MKINIRLLCVVFLISAAEAAKILGIFMVPSYSHQIVYQKIWKELSLRGHDVTVFTPNPLKDPTLTNLTEFDMGFSYEICKNYSKDNFDKHTKLEETKNLFKAFSAVYDAQMSSPEMQKLLLNKDKVHFDLFLVEYLYPPMYAFKDLFNCPMIGITSLHVTTGGLESLGMVKHPALDPEFILPFSTDLNFWQRVISSLLYVVGKVNLAFKMGPELSAEARKYFGPKTRDVMEIARDTSLVLGNFNYITQNIRPNVPTFIEIPGIHLHPEKPLPKDLKKFLDEANEGVVYFSLGSNVKSSLLPKDRLNAILSAFSKLPYKVLFKFEADDTKNMSSVSSNVEMRKWIPQQDVLRHPNVKLFVSQGGLQSIDEALASKVPMLIIPIFGDQDFNAHKMVNSGMALSLELSELTRDELVQKINEIIQNPKFKKAATELGSKAFDHQVPPLEKAVWWIEYVLRHNGAHHLRYKGVDMPAYQFYLVDVFCFLGCIVAVTSYILYKITKFLIAVYTFLHRTWRSNLSIKKSQ